MALSARRPAKLNGLGGHVRKADRLPPGALAEVEDLAEPGIPVIAERPRQPATAKLAETPKAKPLHERPARAGQNQPVPPGPATLRPYGDWLDSDLLLLASICATFTEAQLVEAPTLQTIRLAVAWELSHRNLDPAVYAEALAERARAAMLAVVQAATGGR